MLTAFCALTGIPPAACAMIGDSTHDLDSGRAAGMTTIAVLTGLATRADLEPHADVVLDDISALPDWLGTLTGRALPRGTRLRRTDAPRDFLRDAARLLGQRFISTVSLRPDLGRAQTCRRRGATRPSPRSPAAPMPALAQNCKSDGSLRYLGNTRDAARSVWLSRTGAGSFALESAQGSHVVDTWSRPPARQLHISASPVVSQRQRRYPQAAGDGRQQALRDRHPEPEGRHYPAADHHQSGAAAHRQLLPRFRRAHARPSARCPRAASPPACPAASARPSARCPRPASRPTRPGGVQPPIGTLPPSRHHPQPGPVASSRPIGTLPPSAASPPPGPAASGRLSAPCRPAGIDARRSRRRPASGRHAPARRWRAGRTRRRPRPRAIAGVRPDRRRPALPRPRRFAVSIRGRPATRRRPADLPAGDARRCRRRGAADRRPRAGGADALEPLGAALLHVSISDERYGLDVDTELASLTLGIDRRIGDDFVLGALISFQNSDSDGFDKNLTVESTGFNLGPYAAWRLSPQLGARRNAELRPLRQRLARSVGLDGSYDFAADLRLRSPRTGNTLSRSISSARRPRSPTATSPTTATAWTAAVLGAPLDVRFPERQLPLRRSDRRPGGQPHLHLRRRGQDRDALSRARRRLRLRAAERR